MNKGVFFAAMFVLAVLTAQCAAAITTEGRIKLLAVSELEDGSLSGSVADLSLEIIKGSGRVFVNTYPMSKLDTQMSMRFAKQLACKHSKTECGAYDFIYTIKAESSLVGGPSAGAAAAVLTSAMLEDLKLKDGIAITGTINSGGLIGPVGGVNEKIDAAAKAGISKVLVPEWEIVSNTSNASIIAEEMGIELIGVASLDDALFEFTGIKPAEDKGELKASSEYESIMKELAEMLCSRSESLQKEYLESPSIPPGQYEEFMADSEKEAVNSTAKAMKSFENHDYYTAASYCFRANLEYRSMIYFLKNFSENRTMELVEKLEREIAKVDEGLSSKEIKTITDIQAYMISKERVDEAAETRSNVEKDIGDRKKSAYWLAYGEERLFSAYTWSYFFGLEGQDFEINNETLAEACSIKISEAEERFNYVNFYFDGTLSDTRKGIESAKKDQRNGNFEMCTYKASKAKAEANAILGLIGVEKDALSLILSQKIRAAEKVVIEQQNEGIFPIMGYSYLEYAKALAGEDESAAIIYSEYAMELSSFEFYFEKTEGFSIQKLISIGRIDRQIIGMLLIGLGIGFVLGRLASAGNKRNPAAKAKPGKRNKAKSKRKN